MDSAADLRSRVVALEHKLPDVSQRLTAIETWQRQKDVESARHDERWIAMEIRIDNRFSGLESSVRDIKTSLSRINWMIISGIVAGIVGFLIRGGFAP
ncbi:MULTISPECIES: hypothetical protein [unclassified Rhizobium]|uniref:hypothetical protein n=1 Tax=unclassified Rhizobium TaxID=2613769 RepID=UPI0006F59F9A|nr:MULTISPECIES: hypothetical protein [unclassified Rhizobium]KQV36451.1 hypothetical protein ASC86_24760 [Rhizobium sp. Root1212]KRD26741.1 hypothetical protein ASE37_24675 [Rhizobium sp. Root268]